MKRPRKSAKKSRRLKVIRLWNYPEAVRAVPYLRSVLDALRNHYLDSLRHRLTVKRLSERKPERSNLIALEEARKDLDRAQDAFKDAHRELRRIDVFLLDPLEGIALVPCQKNDDLAWMVFEQFDKTGLVGWRWHKDAFEMRRPIADLAGPLALSAEAKAASGS
jgi:hypothetical protein